MESPITESDAPAPEKIALKIARVFFKETFGKNPMAVCLANNHIMDYGERGFRDTLARLKEEKISFFGAGTLSENCNNPLLLEMGGLRLAFMGYVCPTTHPIFATDSRSGVVPIDLSRIREDIQIAKNQKADRIIIQLHWGEEEVYLPKPEDVLTARQIIDIGADLIIGHHAHCVQPYEKYKDGYIFYGVGNAIFADLKAPYLKCGQLKTYIKRQQYWNKSALIVGYFLKDKEVKVHRLRFTDGSHVSRRDAEEPSSLISLKNYRKRYSFACKISILRSLVVNFFQKPKIPKIGNFKSVAGMLFKREL